jgi:small subunit ribosomal protein S20
MAHHKSALKSIRQDARRTERNRYFKTTMRTHIKQIRNFLADNQVDEAKELLPKTCGVIDKCVTKRIIHKNTAARYKSGLANAIAKHQPEAKPAKGAKAAKATRTAKPKTARAAKPKAPKAEKPAAE